MLVTATTGKVIALQLVTFKGFIERGVEGRVAYADVKELPGLNDPLKDVVFIGLCAQREAVFEGGVVGDDPGDVLKRLCIDVAANALPAVDLAGQ